MSSLRSCPSSEARSIFAWLPQSVQYRRLHTHTHTLAVNHIIIRHPLHSSQATSLGSQHSRRFVFACALLPPRRNDVKPYSLTYSLWLGILFKHCTHSAVEIPEQVSIRRGNLTTCATLPAKYVARDRRRKLKRIQKTKECKQK